MAVICFVCNFPILSHQVCLIWHGENGIDEISQIISNNRRKTLADISVPVNRRDSSAQICTSVGRQIRETSPPISNKRQRSLSQLTEVMRDWKLGSRDKEISTKKRVLGRRETLAGMIKKDVRKDNLQVENFLELEERPSEFMNAKPRRKSGTDLKSDISRFFRRESAEFGKQIRKDADKKKRTDSTTQVYYKAQQDTVSSHSDDSKQISSLKSQKKIVIRPVFTVKSQKLLKRQNAASEDNSSDSSRLSSQFVPNAFTKSTHNSDLPPQAAQLHARKYEEDKKFEEDKKLSERESSRQFHTDDKGKLSESSSIRLKSEPDFLAPLYFPTLAPQNIEPLPSSKTEGKMRIESTECQTTSLKKINKVSKLKQSKNFLSADYAEEINRTSSGDHSGSSEGTSRDNSPKSQMQFSEAVGMKTLKKQTKRKKIKKSDTSSSCSSRETSPHPKYSIVQQSTTEEILIARGFRRQSTTEDIMRARNFRRQSVVHDNDISKSRGRIDSAVQIIDGTMATMTVEKICSFVDIATQTGIADC